MDSLLRGGFAPRSDVVHVDRRARASPCLLPALEPAHDGAGWTGRGLLGGGPEQQQDEDRFHGGPVLLQGEVMKLVACAFAVDMAEVALGIDAVAHHLL